jgi:hypothetical protein
MNESDADDRIRSVLGGFTTICKVVVMDRGGAPESVIVIKIENVPLAVGMPLSCPFANVKPGGSVPVTAKT